MPFLDDTGVADSRRSPVPAAFAALADQVERLVAVNIAWAVQVAPGMLALAFPALPTALRLALGLWTIVVLAPVTGVLFAVAAAAVRHQHVGLELVADAIRSHARTAATSLGPLYGGIGLLLWTCSIGSTPVRVLAGWALLAAAMTAMYWGPVFAHDPSRGPVEIAAISLRCTVANPARTIGVAAASLLVGLLSVISVGGFFLVAPIVFALLQTALYHRVLREGR